MSRKIKFTLRVRNLLFAILLAEIPLNINAEVSIGDHIEYGSVEMFNIERKKEREIIATEFNPALLVTNHIIDEKITTLESLGIDDRKIVELGILYLRAIYNLDYDSMRKYVDSFRWLEIEKQTEEEKDMMKRQRDYLLIGTDIYFSHIIRSSEIVFLRTVIKQKDTDEKLLNLLMSFSSEEGGLKLTNQKNRELKIAIDNHFPFGSYRYKYPAPIVRSPSIDVLKKSIWPSSS